MQMLQKSHLRNNNGFKFCEHTGNFTSAFLEKHLKFGRHSKKCLFLTSPIFAISANGNFILQVAQAQFFKVISDSSLSCAFCIQFIKNPISNKFLILSLLTTSTIITPLQDFTIPRIQPFSQSGRLWLSFCSLYSFTIAAITNSHEVSGFKQYKFILLHFWRSEVQNYSHQAKFKFLAGLVPSGCSGGRIHPSRVHLHSSLYTLFLLSLQLPLSHHLLFTLTSCLFLMRTVSHSDNPGLSPYLKILNSIMSPKSCLPYKVIFSGSRYQEIDIFGGDHFQPMCFLKIYSHETCQNEKNQMIINSRLQIFHFLDILYDMKYQDFIIV